MNVSSGYEGSTEVRRIADLELNADVSSVNWDFEGCARVADELRDG